MTWRHGNNSNKKGSSKNKEDSNQTEQPPSRGGADRYGLRAQPMATDAYTPDDGGGKLPPSSRADGGGKQTPPPRARDPTSESSDISSSERFSGGGSDLTSPTHPSPQGDTNPWKDHRNRIVAIHSTPQQSVVDMTGDPSSASATDRDIFTTAVSTTFQFHPGDDDSESGNSSASPDPDAPLKSDIPPTIVTTPITQRNEPRASSPPGVKDPPRELDSPARRDALATAAADLRSEMARGSALLSANATAFVPLGQTPKPVDPTDVHALLATIQQRATAITNMETRIERRLSAWDERREKLEQDMKETQALLDKETNLLLAKRLMDWDTARTDLETQISKSCSDLDSRISSVTSLITDDALTARIATAVSTALSTHTADWTAARNDISVKLEKASSLLDEHNLENRILAAVTSALSTQSAQQLTEFAHLLNEHRRTTALSITAYGKTVEESMAATANKYIDIIKRAGTTATKAARRSDPALGRDGPSSSNSINPSDSASALTGSSSRSVDPTGHKYTPTKARRTSDSPSPSSHRADYTESKSTPYAKSVTRESTRDHRGYPTTTHYPSATTVQSTTTEPTSNTSSFPQTNTNAPSAHNKPSVHPWIRSQPPDTTSPPAIPSAAPLTFASCSGGTRLSLYHEGRFGILDGFDLTPTFLRDTLGFTDEDSFQEMCRIHRSIRGNWFHKTNNTKGPQRDLIYSSKHLSNLKLEDFSLRSVVNWYERLVHVCESHHIALVPFNAIQFSKGLLGLCIPGLGSERFVDMASALCTVLALLLDGAPSRVTMMVRTTEKSHNGYDILWRLLGLYVPGFDDTRTIDRPLWSASNGDAIDFADAFDLYFRLCAKANLFYSDLTRSRLFLEGITDPSLKAIVDAFLVALDTEPPYLGKEGQLPPKLCMPELAITINRRTAPDDTQHQIGPFYAPARINNLAHPTRALNNDDDDLSVASNPGHIQGYRVYAMARSPSATNPSNTHGDSPRKGYPRTTDPSRRRSPETQTVSCKACGRPGHTASTCHFLAQSVFMQKYLARGHVNSAEIDAAEKNWLETWKSKGGNPGKHTPRSVHAAYVSKYGFSQEQLEDEIDWNCWPVEDDSE